MTMKTLSSIAPEGVFVRLKNKILLALNIDPLRLKILVDRYVLRTHKEESESKRNSVKSSILSELNAPKMTIKVFFMFLRIIETSEIEFIVKIKTRKGTEATINEKLEFVLTDNED